MGALQPQADSHGFDPHRDGAVRFPVGDVAGNTERIIEMIGQARDEYGAELVMFPSWQ